MKKEKSVQPSSGNYRDWKELIASECWNQCVYCAIHERDFGGIRNFHIEHYRPKSLFPKLIDDIKNLFYACAICNVFKGSDWPDEPSSKFNNPSYPDPSKIDYSDIFKLDADKGEIFGKYTASIYMTEKLYLNRPQLILLRRKYKVFSRLESLLDFIYNTLPILKEKEESKSKEYAIKCAVLLTNILSLKLNLDKMRPYEKEDVTRG